MPEAQCEKGGEAALEVRSGASYAEPPSRRTKPGKLVRMKWRVRCIESQVNGLPSTVPSAGEGHESSKVALA